LPTIAQSAREAVADIPDGATIMVGGVHLCGIPENLIGALHERGVRDLTLISNNAGTEDFGVGLLIANAQVRKLIASFLGGNMDVQRRYFRGEIELELLPQGTFVERARAAGAGIGGFFAPTAPGTAVAQGKEIREIDGRPCVFEPAFSADFALVKGFRGDTAGNLTYRKTTRNFNPAMALAGRTTIAEVEELLSAGALHPEAVVTPGIFVQRIFQGPKYEKRIEIRAVRVDLDVRNADQRDRIARRVAAELRAGEYVSLGMGIPAHAASYIRPELDITIHSGTGVLGIGDYPGADAVDPDLINGGRETISVVPGAAFFGGNEAFDLVRGGHLDTAVLGALEVDAEGSVASWTVPGKLVNGVGGAMDLAISAKRVIVAVEHGTPDGKSRIVRRCTLPLTAARVAQAIISELAVIDVTPAGLVVREIAGDTTLDVLRARTAAELDVDHIRGTFQ
jgi:3-oxoacid CoA-transferase